VSNYRTCAEIGQFRGLDNVCFLPHKQYLSGMRERHVVQYPLARQIAEGDLSRIPEFEGFGGKRILVLCNLRPVSDVRPDILAITTSGDILLIECKVRTVSEGNDGKAVRKLSRAAGQLAEYHVKLQRYAQQVLGDAHSAGEDVFRAWAELHERVYSSKHGFPDLRNMLDVVFNMNAREQKELALSVFRSLAKGSMTPVLAFNGPADGRITGYGCMDPRTLTRTALLGWRKGLGSLWFFSVDHSRGAVEVIDADQTEDGAMASFQEMPDQVPVQRAKETERYKLAAGYRQSESEEEFYQHLLIRYGGCVAETARRVHLWATGYVQLVSSRTAFRYHRMDFILQKTAIAWLKSDPADVKISLSSIQHFVPFNSQHGRARLCRMLESVPGMISGTARYKIGLRALSEKHVFNAFSKIMEIIVEDIRANA